MLKQVQHDLILLITDIQLLKIANKSRSSRLARLNVSGKPPLETCPHPKVRLIKPSMRD
jgi:hypothetical protein